MENENPHYFKAELSLIRKGIKNGNIEIYSLNQSFVNGVLWKLYIYPSSDWSVRGFLEKTSNKEVISSTWEEAKGAIIGNFLNVSGITQCKPFSDELEIEKLQDIAFTLRVDAGNQEELKMFQRTNYAEEGYTIETGNMKTENQVTNVHGVIAFEGDMSYPLEECAMLLSKTFPKRLITWLSYCLSPGGYKNKTFNL